MAKIIEAGGGLAIRCTSVLKRAGLAAGTPHSSDAITSNVYLICIGDVILALGRSSINAEQRAHIISKLSASAGYIGSATTNKIQENGGAFALQLTPACEDMQSGDFFGYGRRGKVLDEPDGVNVAVRAPTREDAYGDEKSLGVVLVSQYPKELDEFTEAVTEMRKSHIRTESDDEDDE